MDEDEDRLMGRPPLPPLMGPGGRQCKATAARTGERCRLPPIAGGVVCHKHGGSARQVKAAAARRVTEAKALEVYQRYAPNGDGPVDVLAELAHLVAVVTRFARFAEARLAALGEDDWQPGNEATMTEVRMFRQAQETAGRLLTDVARLGIEASVASQAERLEISRAETIVAAFEAAISVLDLTDDQRRRAGPAMGRLLLHLTGET